MLLPLARRAAAPRDAWLLVAARTVSALGDQLARVALSYVVLQRSGSPALAAGAFASTFLPAVLGTALLSGVGDRLPRRGVLVGGDLLRALLVLGMSVPGLPLAALFALVVLVTLVDGPCAATRSALLRACAGTEARYLRVTSVDETAVQSAQILGYAVGGALVLTLGATLSLRLDAVTFLGSALLLLLVRPARRRAGAAPGTARRTDLRVGWAAAMAPGARGPVLLTWALVSSAVAPEALAVVWAVDRGLGPVGAAALLAANPVGSVVGLLLLSRLGLERVRRLQSSLVLLSLVPLLLCALEPPLPVLLGLVTLSGVGLTVTTVCRVAFSSRVDDEVRARAFGVAGTGLVLGQALGIAAAGAVAEAASPGVAVAGTAALGLLLVGLVRHADPAGRTLVAA